MHTYLVRIQQTDTTTLMLEFPASSVVQAAIQASLRGRILDIYIRYDDSLSTSVDAGAPFGL